MSRQARFASLRTTFRTQIPTTSTGTDYRAALAVTVAALEQHNNSLTPRARGADLRRRIRFHRRSRNFPHRHAEALAAGPRHAACRRCIRHGGPGAIRRDVRDAGSRPAGEREAAESQHYRGHIPELATWPVRCERCSRIRPARSRLQTWPTWLPWLAFLPLLPAFLIAAATFRPAARASLTNPDAGQRGKPIELPLDGLIVSAPAPERRLARQIAWREPVAGRRIHGEKASAPPWTAAAS